MSQRAPRFFLWLGLVAFVTLGMPDAVQGAVWPFMRADLSRPLADLGAIVSAGTLAFVVAATTVARAVRALGLDRTIAVAFGLRLAGFVAIASTDRWWVIVASAAVLGFGGGWQDSAFNIDFALHHGVRAMGLLHAMFGVGATIGPLLVVAFLPSWRPAFWILAAVQTVILAVVLMRVSSWRVLPRGDLEARVGPKYQPILAVFFLYTGLEVSAGGWAFSLLFEGRSASEAVAGGWVAAYWGGLTIGRLVLGAGGDRVGLRRLVDWSLGLATVGWVILWWDPAGLGSIGLPIAGLGLAPLFPGFVTMTPHLAGASHTDAAVGSQLAAAGLGAATLPWIIGRVAETHTLEVLPPILVSAMVMLILLWAVTGRRQAPTVSERAGRSTTGPR